MRQAADAAGRGLEIVVHAVLHRRERLQAFVAARPQLATLMEYRQRLLAIYEMKSAEAEAKIFEKMEALPHDRTVFLISHRFATVRQANQICVIEDGTISELGTHEELVAKDDTYARLFKLQQKGYR